MFKELVLFELRCINLLRMCALQSHVDVLQDRHGVTFTTFLVTVV